MWNAQHHHCHAQQVGQQAKSSKTSSQDKDKPSDLVQMAEFQSTEGEQGSKVTAADKVKDIPVGVVPSLDDAIHMSIDCACECHVTVMCVSHVSWPC